MENSEFKPVKLCLKIDPYIVLNNIWLFYDYLRILNFLIRKFKQYNTDFWFKIVSESWIMSLGR